jgi:hypothetical protein
MAEHIAEPCLTQAPLAPTEYNAAQELLCWYLKRVPQQAFENLASLARLEYLTYQRGIQ